MAELPRYKRGARLISIPTVDFVQTGTAAARVYQNVSSSLNRMSQFTSEQAARQAAREGAEYDFHQGVTLDQLELALEQNRSVDEVVGDPDTVFGAASRGAAGPRLRTEAEARMRAVQAKYLAAADAGQEIDVAALEKEFFGVAEGYGNILGQVDPAEARAFKATISVLGNTVYKSALTNNLKIDAANRIAKADRELDTAEAELTMLLKVPGEDGSSINAAAVLSRELSSNILATNNVDYIEANKNRPREIFIKALNNAITDLSSEARARNPVEFAEKMARGEMANDHIQSLYDKLDADEQLALREIIRKRVSDENAAAEAAFKAQEISLRSDYYKARAALYDPTSTEEQKKNAITVMREIGGAGVVGYEPEKVEADITKTTEAAAPKQPAAVSEILSMIERDEISEIDDADAIMVQYGISNPADILQITKAINADTKADTIEVRRLARAQAKVANELLATPDQQVEMFAFEDKVQRVYQAEYKEWSVEKKGAAPSIVKVARGVSLAERESVFTKNIDMRVEGVQKILDDAGISITVNEFTTFSELEDLLEDAEVKSGRVTQIKNALKAIKEDQKNRREVGY